MTAPTPITAAMGEHEALLWEIRRQIRLDQINPPSAALKRLLAAYLPPAEPTKGANHGRA